MARVSAAWEILDRAGGTVPSGDGRRVTVDQFVPSLPMLEE